MERFPCVLFQSASKSNKGGKKKKRNKNLLLQQGLGKAAGRGHHGDAAGGTTSRSTRVEVHKGGRRGEIQKGAQSIWGTWYLS